MKKHLLPLVCFMPLAVLHAIDAVIIDNSSASVYGPWASSTSYYDYHGSDYLWVGGGPTTDHVKYHLNVPSAGTYKVYVSYSPHANRAWNARYQIRHSGGTDMVFKDQRETYQFEWFIRPWNYLGSWHFSAGDGQDITIFRHSMDVVSADAVMIIKYDDGPVPPGNWSLTFSDEFSSFDTGKWEKVQETTEPKILSARLPANVEVAAGKLRLITRHENYEHREWTSGYVKTRIFTQRYGYFEARIRIPAYDGLNNAFWLTEMYKSEIDVTEAKHGGVNRNRNDVTYNKWYPEHEDWGWKHLTTEDLTEWHVYAVFWDADKIIWYFDGYEVFRFYHVGMASEPHDIKFSTAVQDWIVPPDPALHNTAMEIDWVRVWQRN